MSEIGPKRPLFQQSPILAGFGIAAFVSAAFLIGLSLWSQVGGKSPERTKGPVGLLPESANPSGSSPETPPAVPPNPLPTQQAPIPVPSRVEPPTKDQGRLPEIPIVEEPTTQVPSPSEPAKHTERTPQSAEAATKTARPTPRKSIPASARSPRKKTSEKQQKPVKNTGKTRTPSLGKPSVGAGDGPWRILMGTFKSRDHASLLVHSLASHGIAADMLPQRAADGTEWYLVASGGFATREKAAEVAKQARARDGVPTLIRRTAQKG